MEYLHSNREQFLDAINLAVFKTGLAPEIVEKDYYVTMILKKLAERFDFIVFKGGTSISKCHRVSQGIYNEGLDKGIEGAVELLREAGFGDQDIIEKIMSKYHLTLEAAKKYVLLPTAG